MLKPSNFDDGEILVVPYTTNRLLPVLKRAAGVVCEQPGLDCHAAVVGLTLDIPVVVGAQNATKVLKAGTMVVLDAQRGIVSSKNSQYK